MALWEAALLGVLQGLTEFLPISSTAHLLLARTLLGHPDPKDSFTVVVQLGTLAAVVWYFRADVRTLLAAVAGDLRSGKFASTPDSRLAWLIVLGTVPVVVVGGLFKKPLVDNFYTLPAMGVVAIAFAGLMLAAERYAARRRRYGGDRRGVESVGVFDAMWVGVWQALALMPGASRSGTTITGGLFVGLDRAAAARFSFLLSLPSILAAGAKDLYDEYKVYRDSGGTTGLYASADELVALAVGLAVSGVVGYLSIAWLLGYLQKRSTAVFVAYRVVLGAGILLLVGLRAV